MNRGASNSASASSSSSSSSAAAGSRSSLAGQKVSAGSMLVENTTNSDVPELTDVLSSGVYSILSDLFEGESLTPDVSNLIDSITDDTIKLMVTTQDVDMLLSGIKSSCANNFKYLIIRAATRDTTKNLMKVLAGVDVQLDILFSECTYTPLPCPIASRSGRGLTYDYCLNHISLLKKTRLLELSDDIDSIMSSIQETVRSISDFDEDEDPVGVAALYAYELSRLKLVGVVGYEGDGDDELRSCLQEIYGVTIAHISCLRSLIRRGYASPTPTGSAEAEEGDEELSSSSKVAEVSILSTNTAVGKSESKSNAAEGESEMGRGAASSYGLSANIDRDEYLSEGGSTRRGDDAEVIDFIMSYGVNERTARSFCRNNPELLNNAVDLPHMVFFKQIILSCFPTKNKLVVPLMSLLEERRFNYFTQLLVDNAEKEGTRIDTATRTILQSTAERIFAMRFLSRTDSIKDAALCTKRHRFWNKALDFLYGNPPKVALPNFDDFETMPYYHGSQVTPQAAAVISDSFRSLGWKDYIQDGVDLKKFGLEGKGVREFPTFASFIDPGPHLWSAASVPLFLENFQPVEIELNDLGITECPCTFTVNLTADQSTIIFNLDFGDGEDRSVEFLVSEKICTKGEKFIGGNPAIARRASGEGEPFKNFMDLATCALYKRVGDLAHLFAASSINKARAARSPPVPPCCVAAHDINEMRALLLIGGNLHGLFKQYVGPGPGDYVLKILRGNSGVELGSGGGGGGGGGSNSSASSNSSSVSSIGSGGLAVGRGSSGSGLAVSRGSSGGGLAGARGELRGELGSSSISVLQQSEDPRLTAIRNCLRYMLNHEDITSPPADIDTFINIFITLIKNQLSRLNRESLTSAMTTYLRRYMTSEKRLANLINGSINELLTGAFNPKELSGNLFQFEGGKRRTRKKKRLQKRLMQQGGADTLNINQTYISLLFAIIEDYCTILNEYLNTNDSTDIRRILEFLQSETYKVAVNRIDTTQPYRSFIKEAASYIPNQIIYSPSFMKTIFDKSESSNSGSYEVHDLRRIFPMQEEQMLEIFQNHITNKQFSPITFNSNPRFLNILETLADKHPIARRLLEKGGVTPQEGESFVKMLSDVESANSNIDVPNILKAIFKELIPDPVQASSANSLFVTYVMFHGYYVIDYRVVQRFIERINANGGLLPGGFDEMKEIVEGASEAEPVVQEIYTPIKDPRLEALKSSRVDFSNKEDLGPMVEPVVEPEFQPPMIAAGAAGGRRTRRRKAMKVKVNGSRRNRLTKKERNS